MKSLLVVGLQTEVRILHHAYVKKTLQLVFVNEFVWCVDLDEDTVEFQRNRFAEGWTFRSLVLCIGYRELISMW